MIEQIEMIVTTWNFNLLNISNSFEHLTNRTTMHIMQKRNAIKKVLPAG
jgi:hypothetical protein